MDNKFSLFIKRVKFLLSIKNTLVLPLIILLTLYFSAIYFLYDNYSKNHDELVNIQRMNDLATFGYEFNIENYHTQLELWEYAYDPSPERLEKFKEHELALLEKFKIFNDKIQSYYLDKGSESVVEIEEIKFYLAQLRKKYELLNQVIFKSRDDKVFINLMRSIENKFDAFDLDAKIEHVIALQVKEFKDTNALNERKDWLRFKFTLFILTITILFLSALIVIIKKREQKLFRQLIQAEKLTSLGQMSAGVAHELNNPLMFTKGFNGRVRSTLAKLGIENESLTDYLNEIDEGLSRMSVIINHLRDFSRVSTKAKDIFNPNRVIEKSFSFFSEQLRLRGIEVYLELGTEEMRIKGNLNRLEQVFINLISNSRDALNEKESQKDKYIRVTTELADGYFIVKFCDNGPGIPAKNAEHIFEPFFTTKPVGVGTGLGLSIVHEIIVEHNGEISLDQDVNVGTMFIIKIPVVAAGVQDFKKVS